MTDNREMADVGKPTSVHSDGSMACAYRCGFRARFYVGDDRTGSYCCARHLAFYVREHQAMAPTEWLKVCELTDD